MYSVPICYFSPQTCVRVCVCVYMHMYSEHLWECVCMLTQSYPSLLRSHGLYVAQQAPLFIGFSRQEYWSGLPIPSSGDLPNPGMKPESSVAPTLAGGFFTTEAPGKPLGMCIQFLMPLNYSPQVVVYRYVQNMENPEAMFPMIPFSRTSWIYQKGLSTGI